MNNKTEKSEAEKRTRTRPLVYVAITLSLAIGICCGKLVQTPTNTTVSVGNRAVLQCQTDQPLTVFWYFNDKEIFYGGRISLEHASKFEIEIGSTSNGKYYNLVIPSADTWYNGRYTCGDDEGQGESKSAWLTVTDSPTTVASVPLPETDASTQAMTVGLIAVVVGVVVGIVILVYCILKRRRVNQHTEARLIEDKEKAPADQHNNRKNCGVGEASEDKGTAQRSKPGTNTEHRSIPEKPNEYVDTASLPPVKTRIDAIEKRQQPAFNETGKTLSMTHSLKPKNPISPISEGEKGETTIGKNISAESVIAAGNDDPVPQDNAESNSKPTADDALLEDSESDPLQESEEKCSAEDINGEGEATTDKEKDENASLLSSNTTSNKVNSSGISIHN